MEIWDIYDENRKKTKRTVMRGNPILKGDYHLVVHVWITNDKRELLIQKRQPWKVGWPNMWDCSVAGCALSGENTQQAAIRETKEELGIDLNINENDIFSIVRFSSGFDDTWLVRQNVNTDRLKLQYAEVADAKWVKCSEIRQLILNGEFIEYDYVDKLFNLITND